MSGRTGCPVCGRGVFNKDPQAFRQHLKAWCGRDPGHMRAYQALLRDEKRARRADRAAREDGPSMAELAIEATIKRDMGERLDPLEESLLP